MTTSRRLATAAILLTLVSACSTTRSVGDPTARPAPEISARTWINTAPIPPEQLRGKVTLIEFCAPSCLICRKVQPRITEWYAKYGNRGLIVIGVLTPMTDVERDPATVEAYVRRNQIPYPIAMDTAAVTWQRFENSVWPTIYLVDKRGAIRLRQLGEGGYGRMEAQIQALLVEETGTP
jgi:thiol-disulfide isomerase/thioredoxin